MEMVPISAKHSTFMCMGSRGCAERLLALSLQRGFMWMALLLGDLCNKANVGTLLL